MTVDPSLWFYQISPFLSGQQAYRQHTRAVILSQQCLLDCKRVWGLIHYWQHLCEEFTSWMLPFKKKFHFRSAVLKDVVRRTLLLTDAGRWTVAPGELTMQLVVNLSHCDPLFLSKCALICSTLHISLVSHIFCFIRYRRWIQGAVSMNDLQNLLSPLISALIYQMTNSWAFKSGKKRSRKRL